MPFDEVRPQQLSLNERRSQEVEAQNAYTEKHERTARELFDASVQQDHVVPAILDMVKDSEFEADPNFTLSGPDLEDYSFRNGIAPEYMSGMANAVSQEHLDYLGSKIKDDVAAEETLSANGMKGLGMRLLADGTDPILAASSILLAPVTAAIIGGKVLKVALTGHRMNMFNRAMRTGLVAGGENLAAEAFVQQTDATRGASNLVMAFGGGMLLGTGIGAVVGRARTTKFVDDMVLAHTLRNMEQAGATLSPKGQKILAGLQLDAGKVIDEVEIEQANLAMDTNFEGSAGAAAVSGGAEKALVKGEFDDDFLYDLVSDADDRAAFGGLRLDLIGRLKNDASSLARGFANIFAEDGVGRLNKDGVMRATVSETQNLEWRTTGQAFYKVYDGAYDRWLKENNFTMKDRFLNKSRVAFNEEVGLFVRGVQKVDGDYSPDVKQVGKAFQEGHAKRLQLLKDSGVRGAEDIPENPNFMTREVDWEKFGKLKDEIGYDNLVSMVGASFKQSTGLTNDVYIQKLARGYLDSLNQQQHRIAPRMQNGLDVDGDDVEVLEDILKSQNLTRAERTEIIEAIQDGLGKAAKDTSDKDRIKTLKQRFDLDETFSMDVKDMNGRTRKVSLHEIWNNDAEHLFESYNRRTSGWAALSSVARISSPADVQKFKLALQQDGLVAGKTQRQIDKTWHKFEAIIKNSTGHSLEFNPNGDISAISRNLRGINFATMSGQFGVAQMPEFANIMGTAGIENTLKASPQLNKMWRNAQTGDLSDPFFREMESILGMGTDHLINPVHTRPDDMGISDGASKFETGVNQINRVASVASGMAHINAGMQRWGVGAMAHHMLGLANKTELAPKDVRFLKTLGVDEGISKKIFTQMKKHVTYKEGAFKGKNIAQLNFDNWDAEAGGAFRFAMHRINRRMIQENDIGNLILETVESPMLKTLVQFRSFSMVALGKQTLRSLHNPTAANGLSFGFAMAIAGLAYTAQQAALYPSDSKEDRQERKNRLSMDKIIAATFARTGQASMVPWAVDTAAQSARMPSVFKGTRNTGLNTGSGLSVGGLMSNPSAATANNVFRMLNTGMKYMGGEEIRRSDVDAFKKNVPLYRVFGLKHGLDWTSDYIADLDGTDK